ncbi:MAG TPA: hypothetical protein VJB34_06595 [Bdellovibrionota bacterium]|nr:hypothetical protein [Bdellovibrionota bacterium]
MKILKLVGLFFSCAVFMAYAEGPTLNKLLDSIEQARVEGGFLSIPLPQDYIYSTGAIERASQFLRDYHMEQGHDYSPGAIARASAYAESCRTEALRDPIVAYQRWKAGRADRDRAAILQQFGQELADAIRQWGEREIIRMDGEWATFWLENEERRRNREREKTELLEKTNYRERKCMCEIDHWFSKEEKQQVLSFHFGWHNEMIRDFYAAQFLPSLIDEIEKTQSCTPLENKWWARDPKNHLTYESSSLFGTFSFINCSFEIEQAKEQN